MTSLEAAITWIQKGFSPIPVPHRSKRPVLQDWQRLEMTIDGAPQYFNGKSQNIGLHLGDKYGSTDVDCDCTEAIVAARELLPETGLIFGRHSKPFSHFFYRADPPVRTAQFIDPLDHSTLVELRGLSSDGTVGLQTVVPPSIHESGEAVRFESGFEGTPANVDAELLSTAVRMVAAAALLVRHWPTKGSRHHAFLALASVLACAWMERRRRQGVSPRALPVSVANKSGTGHRGYGSPIHVRETLAGRDTTGIPTLVGVIDKKVVDTALRWLGIERTQHRDYHWNDTGNADRLADLYGHELVYSTERKSYYVWNGQQWEFDEFVEVEKRAEKTILEAFGETKHITDAEKRKAFLRFVNGSLSRAALANRMHLVKKKVRQASANDFDRDPWALNTENGTVDLRTGALRPHRPEDLSID